MSNYLKYISEVEQRFKKTKSDIATYWLDQLVTKLQGASQEKVLLTGSVIAILRHPELEREIVIPGLNIVTNDGDIYYAERGVQEAVTDDFEAAAAGLRMGSSAAAVAKTDTDVTTFLSNTALAVAATYPLTNDADGDNTGALVDAATWLYSYTTAQGNDNGIQEGAISDVRAGPSTAVLTHFLFAASFNKTASDTLKVFINHQMNGV